ncbi:tetratricopeptide repeat protein [uncultured Ferrimonas sp.]|uniref:tetratricopeptide repeat protein n=1 Tax=uncultured Ferrimonas sp. TaxID=432640 RepID=UPI00262E9CAC|nr:tetratricopeptide repeat protein [uncultured Ferrimonas sp.]
MTQLEKPVNVSLGQRKKPMPRPRTNRTVPSAVALWLSFSLSGCSLWSEPEQRIARSTLADVAAQQPSMPAPLQLSASQRSAKLATIYQQLLQLEPSPTVRVDIAYRLTQINTNRFEQQTFDAEPTLTQQTLAQQMANQQQQLQQLIGDYRQLLQQFPQRPENEQIRYQLAKALALQGKTDQSLHEMELLLQRFPTSQYRAELHFRRGEIYYNRADYPNAIGAYTAVLHSDNNSNYRINSLYMKGWSQFKLNRFAAANSNFIQVLDAVIDAADANQDAAATAEFDFAQLNSRHQNLANDSQRVLSISLSQQQQANSLLQLIKQQPDSTQLPRYQHLLFANLAEFLLQKELIHDAQRSYNAYITLAPNSIWAARYSQPLLQLYQRQGKFAAMRQLQRHYLQQYGLSSDFWQQASSQQQQELLPHLLKFADQHSRRLYASSQQLTDGTARARGFANAASAFAVYLQLAQLPQAQALLSRPIEADRYLMADAHFEAQQYAPALRQYQQLAYPARPATDPEAAQRQQQAAYATTVTARQLLSQAQAKADVSSDNVATLTQQRQALDWQFIEHYPHDPRALELANQGAQLAFDDNDHPSLLRYRDFVLQRHNFMQSQQLAALEGQRISLGSINSLSGTALQQLQRVTQLVAHSWYQQEQYQQAEAAYQLALQFVAPNLAHGTDRKPAAADRAAQSRAEMRQLLASSIYFQAQQLQPDEPQQAVAQLLRIGEVVPESDYRQNAEFEAANLLLQQQQWQQAIAVLLPFAQRYPDHAFSDTIPAKLAESYQALGQWELAAQQLLLLAKNEQQQPQLQRQAQYRAAELYLQAGNNSAALDAFRRYAHRYPEPFDVAQEVRFKMSEFYRSSGEANKQQFWFGKILSAHKQQTQRQATVPARAIELASIAAMGMGQAHQRQFSQAKLKIPLKASLQRKQQAMQQAIERYQQVLQLQQANHVPHATYQLAEMYRLLAADIMSSQRPAELDELALEEYEILLEELAYPFEEKAIEIHISNSQRAWQQIYDQWVAASFKQLALMSPAMYQKQEQRHELVDAIY